MKRLEHIKLCCPATAYTEDEFSVLGLCYKLINKMNDVVDELNETTGSVTELSTDVSELRTEHNALVGAVEETAGEINESISNINTRVDNVSENLEAVENEFADSTVIEETTTTELISDYYVDVNCKFPTITIKSPSSMGSTPVSLFFVFTINNVEYECAFERPKHSGSFPEVFTFGFAECGGGKMPVLTVNGKVFAESESYSNTDTFGGTIIPRNAIIDNLGLDMTKNLPVGTYIRVEG